MAKRKLSQQQNRRIRHKQQQRIRRLDDEAQLLPNDEQLGPEQEGLVVANFGQQVSIENPQQQRQRCYLRQHLQTLVTGDRVVWRESLADDGIGVVEALLPRQSLLSRPDSRGQLRPVAANIDLMIIVIAVEPEPFTNLIDRYLVAAELLAIQPMLLLNKADLLTAESELPNILQQYRNIGYNCLSLSSLNPQDMQQLETAIQNNTSIFVGQSGVGKSSLINRLLPDQELAVGALSQAKSKGTHTTTRSELFHLPAGGSVIDSPGIREFGLWQLPPEELAQGFREFQPLLGQCQFRDCQHHAGQLGCALQQAAAKGEILPRRLQSYHHILQSML